MPRSRSRSPRMRARGNRSRSKGRRSRSRHRSPPPGKRDRSRRSRSRSRGRIRQSPRRRSPNRFARPPPSRDLRDRIRRSPSFTRLTDHPYRKVPDRRPPADHHRGDRPRPQLLSSSSQQQQKPQQKQQQESKKELGYTGRSLNERFFSKFDAVDFVPADNISVGIERNIKGSAKAVVDCLIKAEFVVVSRRRDEGEIALCSRAEFEEDEQEPEERRTIRVTANENSSVENKQLLKRLDRQYDEHGNFEVRRDRFMYHDDGRSGDGRSGDSRRDLRQHLAQRRAGDKDVEMPDREESFGNRRKMESNRLSGRLGELPDFSSRPDKYSLSWVDDPAMIPRGEQYFEHDTRDDPNFNSRGERRVRGGWRGRDGGVGGRWRGGNSRGGGGVGSGYRGSGRGGSWRGGGGGGFGRGRGRGWRPAHEDPWKHDKFEEADDSSETKETMKSESVQMKLEEPSSTT